MPRIGVTGGVGAGKSTVVGILRRLGAITFSSDEIAREVLAAGSGALQQVAEQFGAEMILPDGSLDRPRLAARVFADPRARRQLESLTHPVIRDLLRRRMLEAARQNPGAVLVAEVPLLYELGMEPEFDAVIAVVAPDALRVERLAERSGLSEEEARERMAAQWPQELKAARAMFTVENSGDLAALDRALSEIWPRIAELARQKQK